MLQHTAQLIDKKENYLLLFIFDNNVYNLIYLFFYFQSCIWYDFICRFNNNIINQHGYTCTHIIPFTISLDIN